jgi:hypothetical protein
MITLPASLLWSALSFFGGLILGHWLAIGRDKRKELNEVSEAVYLALEKEKKGHGKPSPLIGGPLNEDFLRLRRSLPWWSRRGFEKALTRYRASRTGPAQVTNSTGDVSYRDPDQVVIAIDRLLPYTNKK